MTTKDQTYSVLLFLHANAGKCILLLHGRFNVNGLDGSRSGRLHVWLRVLLGRLRVRLGWLVVLLGRLVVLLGRLVVLLGRLVVLRGRLVVLDFLNGLCWGQLLLGWSASRRRLCLNPKILTNPEIGVSQTLANKAETGYDNVQIV